MTKPVTRAMAVNCLLWRVQDVHATMTWEVDGVRYNCFRCSECGNPILPEQKIQFDHIHADTLDGPHEYQNLRPIHYDPCHKAKSSRDVKGSRKADRIAAGGRKRKGRKMKSKPFPKRKK